ncbi:TIGR03618 family F420-dependent PPOX class oxidoreductase [Umezawaea sp. NPDC059074]|uniref:TIGR03618 family F420-dependent PPOX class oxidoreductase n=1 Tax=Umezawaea sp. NPDC059074 TaxID=3346716 RepID=UPI003694CBEE
MTTIADAEALCTADGGLGTIATLRADGTIQTSVVNLAFLRHPFREAQVVGFVTYGKVKLANLRSRPQITATVKSGWKWAAVEGTAELFGPDDPDDRLDAEGLRLLLRDVFTAAGGTHDDWDAYDREMVEQRRTAVFFEATRVYGVA